MSIEDVLLGLHSFILLNHVVLVIRGDHLLVSVIGVLTHERGWWVHLLRNLVILNVLLLFRLTNLLMQTCLFNILSKRATHGFGKSRTHFRALRRRLYNILDLSLAPKLTLMTPLLRLRTRNKIIRVFRTFFRYRLWIFIEVCLGVLSAAGHLRDV